MAFFGKKLEPVGEGVIGDFVHLPATLADHEGDGFVVIAIRMAAGNKGIEAFKAMNHPEFNQLVECPIDLQRGAKTMIAKLVLNGVGAERSVRFCQGAHDQ